MALFDVKNLSFSYPESDTKLNDINLTVEKGDFILLCGPTGSGKTTLLRLLKPEFTPLGKINGEIKFNGKNISELSPEQSTHIGFIQQDVNYQLVTDKVWHEVAFGMESLGFSQSLMRRRLAETMSYFGIDKLFESNVNNLSGGEKQAVSLASVLSVNPQVIILDEPTSQLDPITASEFLTTLAKLNSEFGITVIITEHRMENVLPLCNKICVLDDGKIIESGLTQQVIKSVCNNQKLLSLMPDSVRLFSLMNGSGDCPLNVKDGKAFMEKNPLPEKEFSIEDPTQNNDIAVKLKDVHFRYTKDSADVLNSTCLEANKGEILCVLGANGSGKTTMLKAISGLITPYSGKIEILGKNIKKYRGQELYNNCIAMLPQNVETVFLHNTLREEFEEAGVDFDSLPFDLSYAADTHPYDLSGGEKQLAAIGKVLSTNPRILLLDEPTKGLDLSAKSKICNVLKELKSKGIAIIIVTHDVEFAALCADRCAMFFRGEAVCSDTPHKFFSENVFYTTSVNKITAESGKCFITVDDVKHYLEV